MSAAENSSATSIIAAVEATFVELSPGAITLHEAEVIDHYGTEAERQKARTRDPERDWRQVPEASLMECRNALNHLDRIGWRFYLPAFIRLALRRLEKRDSPIDEVIYSLALHDDDRQLNDRKRDRFATLDPAQKRAVLAFLEFAAAYDRCDARIAQHALKATWRRAAGG